MIFAIIGALLKKLGPWLVALDLQKKKIFFACFEISGLNLDGNPIEKFSKYHHKEMLKMLQNHEQLKKVRYHLQKVYRSLLEFQVSH